MAVCLFLADVAVVAADFGPPAKGIVEVSQGGGVIRVAKTVSDRNVESDRHRRFVDVPLIRPENEAGVRRHGVCYRQQHFVDLDRCVGSVVTGYVGDLEDRRRCVSEVFYELGPGRFGGVHGRERHVDVEQESLTSGELCVRQTVAAVRWLAVIRIRHYYHYCVKIYVRPEMA